MAKLLFIGHGSFKLTTDNGTVIYIDPFFDGDYSAEADLVLITHEHFDHNKTELVSLKSDGAIFRADDFISGSKYLSLAFKGVKITAVPAYNKNHKTGCVGYVVGADRLNLYFAGDTSKTDHMSTMKDIDYAFLPTDGIYNMDAAEATECANIIGAKHSVPVHTAPPEGEYNEAVAALFTPKSRLIIKQGSEISL